MAKLTTANAGEVAFLPFPATRPMRETLQWLTHVFESHNGTEAREALRKAPRTQLQYVYPETYDFRREGYNTERGALRRKWAVPLWTEIQYVGTVAGGATSIACETDVYDFRADGLALLYKSPSEYQMLDVSAVAGSSITISAASAMTGAYLVPVRTGYVKGDITRRAGFDAMAQAVYDLELNREVTSSEPTQFLGNDLYTSEVLQPNEAFETQLMAQSDGADYELGLVQRRAPWTYTRASVTHQYVLEGLDQVFAFRQFLARRAGKYRAFWQPSFEPDLKKSGSGNITTAFNFKKDSFLEWASDRIHVAFQDDTGTWYPRTLSGVASVDSTTLTSTLSSSLDVPYERLRCVSFLGLKRLMADQVDLNWIGNAVVTSNVGVLELAP